MLRFPTLRVGFLIRSLLPVAAAGALFALPAFAQAAFPGANGKIAISTLRGVQGYECYAHISHCVFTINPDGTGLTNLQATCIYTPCGPAWSPDGTKIAFARDTGYSSDQEDLCCPEIFVMNADGSGKTKITSKNVPPVFGDGPDDLDPTWSPDGTKIAFARRGCWMEFCMRDTIYVINADGSGVETQLAYGRDPAWSPDGSRIAFAHPSNPCCEGTLAVMNADGTGETPLTNNGRHPSWSPDGKRIAFTTGRDGNYEIYTMNSDGTVQTNLTSRAGHDFNPAWSPDGKKIAFTRCPERPCNYSLNIVNVDGTGGAQDVTGYAEEPDWQPIPGPQGSDYKNAAQFCKAERDFLGDETFREKYGGGPNAYGKCVSQAH